MELTEIERAMLIRQCNILQLLEQDDKHAKEYWDCAIEVFENGYRELYSEYLPHLEEPLSAGVYQFACDILNVYDAMDAYKSNHLEDTEVSGNGASTFPGFSADKEIEYLALVNFFAKSGRWDDLMKDPRKLDTHHLEMVPQYEKMISLWKTYGGLGQVLSREQVLALLNIQKR